MVIQACDRAFSNQAWDGVYSPPSESTITTTAVRVKRIERTGVFLVGSLSSLVQCRPWQTQDRSSKNVPSICGWAHKEAALDQIKATNCACDGIWGRIRSYWDSDMNSSRLHPFNTATKRRASRGKQGVQFFIRTRTSHEDRTLPWWRRLFFELCPVKQHTIVQSGDHSRDKPKKTIQDYCRKLDDTEHLFLI
jgi:hypothetical protein